MKRSVSTTVVADAGPLIALAIIGRLDLLRRLFRRVLIPGAVELELHLGSSRPGARVLAAARHAGWLTVVPIPEVPDHLLATVDRGEAEAIILAKRESDLLLIDESRGRTAARSESVRLFGTGAVLVRAKEKRLIPQVRPELDALQQVGYRISSALRAEILRLAGDQEQA